MGAIILKRFIIPGFQVSKAYITLRSNILFWGGDMKIIGLTSCNQEEGKSVVALNLAISMAETGKKVILVDADMGKSSLSAKVTFDRLNGGLGNYLAGTKPVDEVICQTNIENLDMVLSDPDPRNSSDLLSNKGFGNLMKELAETYDYVLVDAPPIGITLDGAIAAKVCDGMILIVKANTVSYKMGGISKTRLEEAGSPILGAVILQSYKRNIKICFAASTGGHYEQLLMLKPLMDKYNSILITEKVDYNTTRTDSGKMYFLKQVNRKERLFPVYMLINIFRSLKIFLKEKPDIIITTGVLSMIPISIIAKIFRKKLIYIESFAKITAPTLTGKFLYQFADQFYVQWEELLKTFPKAIYKGGIY